MSHDLWSLYDLMYRSRIFEEAVRKIWKDGGISGEMHLAMGEEAIAAGIVSQLIEGDAMALDHRGTAPLLMRGVDPAHLLCEFMGKPDGLGGGMGGHMHLFAPDKIAASSGIVGSAGPAATGFGLAAQMLRPGTVSVAFFGEGATSEGMLMEAMNLAVVWNLPVLFICKDNDWEISTPVATAVGGNLLARAEAFGLKAFEVDGADVLETFSVAETALKHIRDGKGPAFILAHCIHLEGHFLGDPLLDMFRRPFYSFQKRIWPMIKGFFYRGGAPLGERIASVRKTLGDVFSAQGQTNRSRDPLVRTRQALAQKDSKRLADMEASIDQDIKRVVTIALRSEGSAS